MRYGKNVVRPKQHSLQPGEAAPELEDKERHAEVCMQGREKIHLIETFTDMGFDILVSDVDTVW